MGNKRKKLKKVLSPLTSPTPPEDAGDDGLVDDLLAELDAREQEDVAQAKPEVVKEVVQQVVTENGPKKDSRTRHKEREMRKLAARLAQQGPDDDAAAAERIRIETGEEEKTIKGICEAEGLEIHEVIPDGHCLFAAIADQLALLSIIPPSKATYQTTRHVAAQYILEHPDDFLPFLVALQVEDTPGSHKDGPMTMADLEKYCITIRDTGAWGGEPEILALARAYNVPIHVVQWGSPSIVVHSPQSSDIKASSSDGHAVRISYHRRMYGLGEHYNSLRPKSRTILR